MMDTNERLMAKVVKVSGIRWRTFDWCSLWTSFQFLFLDLSRGLCFSQVDNGICKGSTKMMLLVTKSDCCCTAGTAWGSQCILCPRPETGMYYWKHEQEHIWQSTDCECFK
jgi:hypothetical protein